VRRANGEGSIFKEASGRYRIAITVLQDGKRKRITRTAWKHAAAVEILKKLRTEFRPSDSGVVTIDDLMTKWMDLKCRPLKSDDGKPLESSRPGCAENTLAIRETALKKYIRPYVGSRKLADFTALDLEGWGERLRKDGVKPGAIKAAWNTMRVAFTYAHKLRIISDSPFHVVKCPKYSAKKMQPFTTDEVKKILAYTKGTRWHVVMVLAFYTGMRQGEIIGLRWDRVNLQDGYLVVDSQFTEIRGRNHKRPPKTSTGNRTIPLAKGVLDALRDHKAIMLKEGLAAHEYVCPASNGSILLRSNFWSLVWKPMLDVLKIQHRGMHNTRHTFASLAIAGGMNVAEAAKILGHKNHATTWNTYTHAMPSEQEQTVKKIGLLYG